MDTKERLENLAVSDTGFVFDPTSGATFSANGAAMILLTGLKLGRERRGLIASLEDAFDVVGGDLERDLDEFVGVLRANGIVAADFEVAS